MNYNMRLNKYPDRIIQRTTTTKKMAMSLSVIIFFNSIACGNDKPTTPIIKAIAVPNGIPLTTST